MVDMAPIKNINEVNAQLWAFKTLKDLKLLKIYRDSLMWVNCLWGSTDKHKMGYVKARKIIMEKLTKQKCKYSNLDDLNKCI